MKFLCRVVLNNFIFGNSSKYIIENSFPIFMRAFRDKGPGFVR